MPKDESHLRSEFVSSETVYEGDVVNLYLHHIELPNGKPKMREVIKHSGAVAIVPMITDTDVILVRQFRAAIGKVMWEIPAGTLEPNEDLQVAARRELQEEIGYTANTLQKLSAVYVAPGYSDEIIHLYLGKDLVPEKIDHDEDEFIDKYQISLAKAVEMVYAQEIHDAKTISGILLAAKQLIK